jgi:hypothetical protein
MSKYVGSAEPLTRQGFREVITDLGVGVPELLAVLAVESKTCGFLPDRRPIILFERHVFHQRTRGRFSQSHPDISNPQPGGYAGLAREYARLERATRLDRSAALMSASWGAGQIMGFNHEAAGFADVETMVAAMQASEDAQLAAVAAFVRSQKLTPLLRARDWASFARRYNGPAYARNKYDVRLAGAYKQYAAGVIPNVEVRRAQLYLTYLGYAPGAIDGLHGKLSRSAVVRFREEHQIESSDRVDKALLEGLQSRVSAL